MCPIQEILLHILSWNKVVTGGAHLSYLDKEAYQNRGEKYVTNT